VEAEEEDRQRIRRKPLRHSELATGQQELAEEQRPSLMIVVESRALQPIKLKIE
jgi:hypothetical protein